MKKRGLIITILLAICVTGCGAPEDLDVNVQPEAPVEESIEVQQLEEEEIIVEESTEEAIVEDEQVEELSDEEWFESLNLTDARFMIFNDITGERKLLENGQEYTLLEGDELACWYPLDWWFADLGPFYLCNGVEKKFGLVMSVDLNYDQIGENSEVKLTVEDEERNRLHTTVYLSK